MKTYKDVIEAVKKWCESHPIAGNGSFDSGEFPDHIDTLKDTHFPLIYVVPRSASVNAGQITFPFDFIAMSQTTEQTAENVAQIRESVTQIQSDMMQIITDFVAAMNSGKLFNDELVEITLPVTAEPFEERHDAVLTGWNASIEIKVESQYCGA